jgi:hypothetical protein
MEDFLGTKMIFGPNRPMIGAVTKVGMAVAKGICHLCHKSAQARGILGQPKGHGVEDMAQKARLGQKAHLRWAGQAMAGQNFAQPNGTAPLLWGPAVVGIVQGRKVGAVARKKRWGRHTGFGIKKHIVDAVAKAVCNRPFAAVERVSGQMLHPHART